VKILIVDDHVENLHLTSDLVKYTGNEALTALNGYEALDILEEEGIQFVIVDWMMPEMNGIELVNRIRAQFSERYIYIIMLTAKSSPEDIVEGLESGADDYISKPFRAREMRARIQTGLRIIGMESRLSQHLSEMEILASHDHLTSLYNRRRFLELAQDILDKYETLSLFMLDIDHFKQVNDNYGHIAGDKVLKKVAETCETSMQSIGLIARYGGEEFVGLLPEYNLEQARAYTETLCREIAQAPVPLADRNIYITVSIGVAEYIAGQSLDDLIEAADDALYQAKADGRNRVEQAT
jgi:diguanylate cyclase (GGDEF)-like protein